jgi:D-alanyl-lipoteichoic acid acyltransferase DltB (MBOAT superfamily)
MASLGGVGLFTFVMLRQVSFAVEAGRGATTGLAGYLCFLLFYPSCFGAVEVFREFRDQNLRGPAPIDYRRGTAAIVGGIVLAAIGVHIPMNEDLMTRSAGFLELWRNLLVLYLRAACVMVGLWSVAEAAASFLGVRLHPNFRGVFAARNPSQFWRAWRGTMANWLVQHVYIPLGGGRQRRTFNIGVVFAASTAWHCLGIPYLRPATWTVQDFAPVCVWGAVNFFGVAGHAWLRRAREPRAYGPLGRTLVAGTQWALTLCFGSLTVALLGFAVAHQDRFAHVLRTLVGLGGW